MIPPTTKIDILPDWLTTIIDTLQTKGINLFGITDGALYTEHLPHCQSAIVFANGGRDLWDSFCLDIQKNPHHLSEYIHPFDGYIHRIINEADPSPTSTRRWIRCAAEPEAFLDFRTIAFQAGIGSHSNMGMLIHSEYGLWMGIRAVILTTEALPLSSPISSSPCSSCPDKPCITSCLGNAVSNTGWNIQTCSQFHVDSTACESSCASRLACPLGQHHKHSHLQHSYHSAPHKNREKLATHLGLRDTTKSLSLAWKDWT